MAWTVIGGLVTSTVLSLVVIPASYLYMDDFNNLLVKWTRRGTGLQPRLPSKEASRQGSV
jgi:hypothetical protein